MVKFFESSYSYDYSFPAVTLAYFLRYPNPYSTHVLSTDVISRDIDAAGRLHTMRIHRKSSRLPPAILKLLPQSVLGNIRSGKSESFILETSTVDVKEGWMHTESKNLDWTGILSVVEKQEYKRHIPTDEGDDFKVGAGTTGVVTRVMFRSRFGERLRARARKDGGLTTDGDDEPKKSFLATWSTNGLQRSIEAIASRKTENQLGKAKEGMMVVLERMRSGGLVGVLEGMRKDREMVGHEGRSPS
jgi:4-amino-4-deoxychorismate lyase